MKKNTISIAMCTYNGERFLGEQLKSIAGQTSPPDELVVCDDCSGDSTIEILRAFRERAAFPVRIHKNEKNMGSTRNFEKSIRLCEGEIIALCDQDDIWRQDKLEHIRGAFADHPDADYVFSDGELVDDDLSPLDCSLWEAVGFRGEIYSRYIAGDQLFGFFRRQFVTGAAMAFRARLKNFVFPFPESPIWIHDGWIAVVGSAVGGGGIALAMPLIRYRQHRGQQIGARVPEMTGSVLEEFLLLKKKRPYFVSQWTEFAGIFPFLLKRLNERPQPDGPGLSRNISELESFRLFFDNRLRIFSAGMFKKAVFISRELGAGRYRKFANSWKSALADLML